MFGTETASSRVGMRPYNRDKFYVGVSSCLLGEAVRYDGGHKFHPIIADVIGPQVHWVPICPEVEAGMGIPREPVNLTGAASDPRLIANETGKDWTAAMKAFAKNRIADALDMRLDGYIFKSNSPSCGVRGIRVYDDNRLLEYRAEGPGIFAAFLIRRFPDLPIAEETELTTKDRAESFLAAVAAYRNQKLSE